MDEIFKQYSGPIITAVIVVSLIAVLVFVVGHDETSTVGKAFSDLITHFFDQANNVLTGTP